jgi:hypothetical protein
LNETRPTTEIQSLRLVVAKRPREEEEGEEAHSEEEDTGN